MKFYGTGAAEGIPSPFCNCEVCKNARIKGGREIRKRTMTRIDEKHCIDMGADAFCQALEYGDFTKLEHVLVTHTHEDHFAFMMFNVRNMAIVRKQEPLHFYLTDKAYDMIDFFCKHQPIMKGMTKQLIEDGVVAFHQLKFKKKYKVGELTVMPLRGSHFGNMGENAANYLIELQDGRYMYYGLDTGAYYKETLEVLQNEAMLKGPLDILVSECTFGLVSGRKPEGHLDAISCIQLFDDLYKRKIIHDQTKIYLTHINHYKGSHEELEHWFDDIIQKENLPYQIVVGYDGLSF